VTPTTHDPRVQALRDRIFGVSRPHYTVIWLDAIDTALKGSVKDAMHALWARVTGAPLDGPVGDGNRTYSPAPWEPDQAWLTPGGEGLIVCRHTFGPMPNDGVDELYHLLLPEDSLISAKVGQDYTQNWIDVWIEAIEPAAVRALAATVGEVMTAVTGLLLVAAPDYATPDYLEGQRPSGPTPPRELERHRS
jgi:hypothetical protein